VRVFLIGKEKDILMNEVQGVVNPYTNQMSL